MFATVPARARKTILVVDDEQVIRGVLCKVLRDLGYDVIEAENGKIAQSLVSLEKIDAVLSDIHMPGSQISGIELLHYIRRVQSVVPVILMTGFATLLETEDAHRSGASGFLAKPFRRDDLAKVFDQVFPKVEEPPVPAEDVDERYRKLSINDFVSGHTIRHSIYVRLPGPRYVKIAHEGEDLDLKRLAAYRAKGIRHLFLERQDFQQYLRFSVGLTQAAVHVGGVSPAKRATLLRHTGEVLLEHLGAQGIDTETFEDAKAVVEATVTFLADSPESAMLIEALNSHSNALYAHSVGVCLYSTMIARQLRWNAASTLYKISMAGLLHDIGKKELEPALLSKPRIALSPVEIALYETHAARGMELLSRVQTVPSEVVQAVHQHHERELGTGYPLGLKRGKIFPLARLIAVADEFCKLAIKGPEGPGLGPAEGCRRLLQLQGGDLDQQFVGALAQVLRVAGRAK